MTTPKITVRDTLERLFWTFVAAFLASFLGNPVLLELIEMASGTVIDLSLLWVAAIAAAMAGLTAVGNAILLIARWRLTVLPTPGEGLPGLPIIDVREVPPVNAPG